MYMDGDLYYNPSTNIFIVGFGVSGQIKTDTITANTHIINSGPGMFYEGSGNLAVGDYNVNGKTVSLWSNGSSYLTAGNGIIQSNYPHYLPATSSNGVNGEVVYYGTGTSLTAGYLYYLNSSSVWTLVDAQLPVAPNGAKYLLAIAVSTNATGGMLIRGHAHFAGVGNYQSVTTGQVLYLATTGGLFSATAPASTGQVVRVIGYSVNATNGTIYFNPDNTWVEIA
jgi:hypothetical protein